MKSRSNSTRRKKKSMATTNSIFFQRTIPVRYEIDVFVAGGGPAGVAAGFAAARQGCSVYIAEGHSCFGGMGTAGMVPAFMMFGDGVNFLAAGFGQELLSRLETAGGTWPEKVPNDNRCSVGIKAEVLKRIYDDMLKSAGADFSFHTQMISVETDGNRVEAVICASKSGLFAVRAQTYIDCTGDGDLAAWAGAPFEKGDGKGNLMPGTLCSLWAGVDFDVFRKSGIRIHDRLEDAFRNGVFTIEDRHLPGIWQVSDKIGGGNIGHTFGVDSTDERSVTEALIQGRKLALEYERFYKEYLRGFEKMELVGTGSLLGIRESRRITGDYVLCLEDFKRRAVFEDEIGRYCYPVDIHPSSPDKECFAQFEEEFKTLRYGKGESYGIPYRILIPKGLDNVLVAGRCVSSDRYIQGSIRVMPGCFITGQAAGVAAGITAEKKTRVRDIDVKELQQRLKNMGALRTSLRPTGYGGASCGPP